VSGHADSREKPRYGLARAGRDRSRSHHRGSHAHREAAQLKSWLLPSLPARRGRGDETTVRGHPQRRDAVTRRVPWLWKGHPGLLTRSSPQPRRTPPSAGGPLIIALPARVGPPCPPPALPRPARGTPVSGRIQASIYAPGPLARMTQSQVRVRLRWPRAWAASPQSGDGDSGSGHAGIYLSSDRAEDKSSTAQTARQGTRRRCRPHHRPRSASRDRLSQP
jgi:hypothetical protein